MMKIAILAFLLIAQVFSKSLVEKEDEASGDKEGVEGPHKRILMQGTKWCGNGNSAENDDDLGEYVELDKCCRTHDKCPRSVGSFSSDYSYTNMWPFTLSDCECDKKFYDCMKAVKSHSDAATKVGKVYFNVLMMPCLNFNEDGTKATKGSSPWY